MRSYQVACPPGSLATIADMVTLGGGGTVTVLNSHATEGLMLGGDENQLSSGGGVTLSTTTGLKLAAGKLISLTLDGNEVLYGRSATSTVTISAHVFRSNFRGPAGVS